MAAVPVKSRLALVGALAAIHGLGGDDLLCKGGPGKDRTYFC
jgi:hypothetical protein